VPSQWRSTNVDFAGSGLSRGHLAPAGAHKTSQKALDETFLLSANIVPQDMSNNGSDWLRLERFATSLLKRHADVWVVSGPLFLPELGAQPPTSTQSQPQAQRAHVSYDVIGVRQVAVPTHLYKVVLADGGEGRRLSAFVMPNAPLPGHSDVSANHAHSALAFQTT